MKILGISSGYHDAALSLIDGSEILFAGHAERYSKHKHDKELNQGLIYDCLQHGQPDVIAYYEKPWLKNTRLIYSGQWSELKHRSWTTRGVVEENLRNSKVNLHRNNKVNLHNIPVKSFSHHLSHAAAGFQTSPFNSAAVLIIDAIGEWQTLSAYEAHYDDKGQAQYKLLFDVKYPHSLGLFYTALTKHVGLKPLDEEYILMGMAAYGHPLIYDDLLRDSWTDLDRLQTRYNHHLGTQIDYVKNTHAMDIAASAQSILEDALCSILFKLSCLTKSRNLVYGGGVALNCLANRFLGQYFPNLWIMPNPGDAGSSLGACALAWGKKLNWKHPYLGLNIPGEYPVDNILKTLLNTGIAGVASGRAEFGPRALGNRSLLADPRGPDIKDRVNDIKQRQKFRPFAPVILADLAQDYFDMPSGWHNSPYMQSVAKCKFPGNYPGICHRDGTSRVQTVSESDHPGLHNLLTAWYKATGCPMLLNTSLNIRQQPMVNDLNDAKMFQNLYNVEVLS